MLVVEDNIYNVIPVRSILRENFKGDIDIAKNGKIGIEMFMKDLLKTCCDVHYNFVLMDIHMPVMNGFDSIHGIMDFQDLKYNSPEPPFQPRAPIFVMTAFES